MITEQLVSWFLTPIMGFLNMLPSVDLKFLENWVYIKQVIVDILRGIGCLIPVYELMPLFTLQMSLLAFRLIWAIILRLKSFIPLLGGA